jgi:hypothetical protein
MPLAMKTRILLLVALTASALACEKHDFLLTSAHVRAHTAGVMSAQRTASNSKKAPPAKPSVPPPAKPRCEKEARPARLNYLLM